MRVVLTGASGYVGTALARAFGQHAHVELIALAHPIATAERRREERLDLTDEAAVERALGVIQPDAIVHAAGCVRGSASDLFRNNAAATVSLANAVLKACPKAVVTALGSAAEYGISSSEALIQEDMPRRPTSVYGHSKLAASVYLDAAARRGLRCNLISVFNIVGVTNSPDQVLGAFIQKAIIARRGLPTSAIPMGPLGAVRDFIALDDLAAAIARLVLDGISGQHLNACSGRGQRVRDLVQHLVTLADCNLTIKEADAAHTAGHGPDRAVGDPARFMSLTRTSALTPIEDVLEAAWLAALASAPVNAASE